MNPPLTETIHVDEFTACGSEQNKKRRSKGLKKTCRSRCRNFREETDTNLSLSRIFHEIKLNHHNNWLLPLEITELLSKNKDN